MKGRLFLTLCFRFNTASVLTFRRLLVGSKFYHDMACVIDVDCKLPNLFKIEVWKM